MFSGEEWPYAQGMKEPRTMTRTRHGWDMIQGHAVQVSQKAVPECLTDALKEQQPLNPCGKQDHAHQVET
jgi:hypothetical protein